MRNTQNAKKTADKKWKDEEIKFIIDNFYKIKIKEIQIVLGRTEASVRNKIVKLGMKKRTKNSPKIGQKFSRLTVIKKHSSDKSRCSKYLCKCDCGKMSVVLGTNLTTKHTTSCGCYNSEEIKKRNRHKIGESSFNKLERAYIVSAKERKGGIEYSLSTEQFRSLIQQNCYWCGKEPRLQNRYYNFDGTRTKGSLTCEEWASLQWIRANGIDRINNSIGYTMENCVPSCTNCNEMKMDRTEQEFISHAYDIVKHQERRKNK